MQLSHGLLLQGPVLLHLQHLVKIGIREVASRDGVDPGRYRLLLGLIGAAADDYRALSSSGHGDVPMSGETAESASSDLLTTREAAAVIGLSERQVRRLKSSLGGVVAPGRDLMFDSAAVEAYAASRSDSRFDRVTVEVSAVLTVSIATLDSPELKAVRSSAAYRNWAGMSGDGDREEDPTLAAVRATAAYQNWDQMPAAQPVKPTAGVRDAARSAVAKMTPEQRSALRTELQAQR